MFVGKQTLVRVVESSVSSSSKEVVELVVRLLEEESCSLRKEGKRVAAESMESVLTKFKVWVERPIEPVPSPAEGFRRLREEIVSMGSGSFRVAWFRLSQSIGADGMAEYSGHGAVEILGGSIAGRERAAAEVATFFPASLPAPLKGYRRVMATVDPYGVLEHKIVPFRFRDVEVKS